MKTTLEPRLRAAVRWLSVAALAASTLAAEGPRSDRYRDGQRALAEERWADAHSSFSELAAAGGPETDAALYWQAWSANKLGRRADALTVLRRLATEHPRSEWLDDAKVLELEITGGKGSQRLEQGEDEDLKLYALDGLMQVEPERAVPILERFLAGDHSLALKERALFVLAMSDTPRARELLLQAVEKGEPPGLRLAAVEQLGVAGRAEDLAALSRIWSGASNEVKLKVLEAWMIAGETAPIFEVARRDGDPELRRKAIELLGVLGATRELGELYAGEKSSEVRERLLEAYGVAGDVAALSRAARGEGDTRLRAKAIEGLGVFGGDEGSRELVALYEVEGDRELRRKIAEALMVNGDAEALVRLFRRETDPEVKRTILQQISLLDDATVDELLREVLGVEP